MELDKNDSEIRRKYKNAGYSIENHDPLELRFPICLWFGQALLYWA